MNDANILTPNETDEVPKTFCFSYLETQPEQGSVQSGYLQCEAALRCSEFTCAWSQKLV